MTLLTQLVMNALVLFALYALVALGLVLVFGVARVINFAHGELYMLGAYIAWILCTKITFPFFAAVIVAGLVTGLIGIAMERGIFRPLRSQPMGGLIGSLGLGLILQVVMLVLLGTGFKTVPQAYPQMISIFGAGLSVQRLIVIIVGVILLAALWIFLERSKYGMAILACAEDREAASLYGMSLNMCAAITMVIGSGLAGIAGGLASPLVPIDPWMGVNVILKAFVIVIVGGVGSVKGALIVALFLGFMESSVGTLLSPVYASLASLLILLVVLSIRPQGIFGND